MTPRAYLKSRLSFYVTDLIGLIIILIFLNAFQIELKATVIIVLVYIGIIAFNEIRSYRARQEFYGPLIGKLRGIDRKYLLPEVIQSPHTYPETIVYDVLQETGSSMTEQVGVYRRQFEDYRDFLELWAHEVKLPVATLQLICSNYPEIGEKIINDVTAIDRNVDNVLYYARSEYAGNDYLIREVRLNDVFFEIAVKYRRQMMMKHVSLEAEGLEVTVLTDDKWLAYILTQLMDNSLKYLSKERDGEIHLLAEDLEDSVVLHFLDNGIGIPESVLPYIFDKSFTGQNGRIGEKSTGFGLYIVKNLCRQLGHTITVKSERDRYTEFLITFRKNRIYGTTFTDSGQGNE